MWNRAVVLIVTVFGAAVIQAQEPAQRISAADQVAAIEAMKHALVRVEYTLQHDKSEAPISGLGKRCPNCGNIHWDAASSLVEEERPLEIAGFLLSPTRVIAQDVKIHERFVKRIAVRFGKRAVEARPAGYVKDRDAMFLELAEPLKDARPLAFDAKKDRPYLLVTYGFDDGRWRIGVKPFGGEVWATAEPERRFRLVPDTGLIVTADGVPVGMAMTNEVPLDDGWKGSPLEWPAYTAEKMAKLVTDLESRTDQSLLRVSLSFRSPKAQERDRARYQRDEEVGTEQNVTGVQIDEETVLVLAGLPPKVTARLERIQVHPVKGEPIPAKFAHTLKDYGAFLATLESPLPKALPWSPEGLLGFRERFLLSAEIRIHGETRIAYFGHSRIRSFEIGWKRQTYPELGYGMERLFLFDPEGALLALPIARREAVSLEERWSEDEPRVTPTAHLRAQLSDLAAHVDPSNAPLSEEQENRLAWLGVELQGLNKALAEANKVSEQTREGKTGALISYVYPDSPAGKAGVKAGEILLRLYVAGRPQPLEVALERYGYASSVFPWEHLDQMPPEYLSEMPTPWPAAENAFRRALTDISFGTEYAAEFFHEGETSQRTFKVVEGPTHYGSAPQYKSDALGLTVRDLTFEVRRYFQKEAGDAGVIVSKIESGGKAAVSGIKPYEIITHVNDTAVHNVSEFEKRITDQPELRLSILRMSQGRQIKIKMETPAGEEEGKP